MDDLRFQVLGAVRAWRGEAELDVGPRKPRAVLAALLLRADRPVSVDDIARSVWGESAPAGVAAAVHTYVAGLRAALDPDRRRHSRCGIVSSSYQGYRLRVAPDRVDALRFQRLMVEARAHWRTGHGSAAAEPLAAALRLWTGRPLADVGDHRPAAVTALEQERLSAGMLAAAVARATDRVEAWLPTLIEIAASAPLHEPLQAALMETFRWAGRRADAFAIFERTRRALSEELGIGPGLHLRDAFRALLDEDRLVANSR